MSKIDINELVDMKEIQKYEDVIRKVVDQFPFIRYILKNYMAYLYGSFVRWLIIFEYENNREPTIKELLKHLETSDIDIRIRSNPKYPLYHPDKIMTDVCDYARKLGGRIEYAGYSYRNKSGVNGVDGTYYENGHTRFHYGTYLVWIPISMATDVNMSDKDEYKGKWIVHDIHILSYKAPNYETDYTVNFFRYKNDGFLDKHRIPDKYLTDIKNKQIVFYERFPYGHMKRLYRGNKLFSKGFTVPDIEKLILREIVVEMLNADNYVDMEDLDWGDVNILDSDIFKPSVENVDKNYVPATKHLFTSITRNKFLDNPFIQHILDGEIDI